MKVKNTQNNFRNNFLKNIDTQWVLGTSFLFFLALFFSVIFLMQFNINTTFATGIELLENYGGLDDELQRAIEGGASSGEILARYIDMIVKIAFGLASIGAVVLIVMGGIEYILAESFSKKSEGKNKLQRAIGALLLLFASFLFFNTLNPELLKVRFEPLDVGGTKEVDTSLGALGFFGHDDPAFSKWKADMRREGLNRQKKTSLSVRAPHSTEKHFKDNCNMIREQKKNRGFNVSSECFVLKDESCIKDYEEGFIPRTPQFILKKCYSFYYAYNDDLKKAREHRSLAESKGFVYHNELSPWLGIYRNRAECTEFAKKADKKDNISVFNNTGVYCIYDRDGINRWTYFYKKI